MTARHDEAATRAERARVIGLFRYQLIREAADPELSRGIHAVIRGQPAEADGPLLPKGISDTDAGALLRCCDRHRPVGLRDYVFVLMLLRLGLRACCPAARSPQPGSASACARSASAPRLGGRAPSPHPSRNCRRRPP